MEGVARVDTDGSAWEVRTELTGMHEVVMKQPLKVRRALRFLNSMHLRGNAYLLILVLSFVFQKMEGASEGAPR